MATKIGGTEENCSECHFIHRRLLEKFELLSEEFSTLKIEMVIRGSADDGEDVARGDKSGKEKEKYKCEKCSYVSNSKASLKKHVTMKHKTIAPQPPLLAPNPLPPKHPVACRRECDGCRNTVLFYSDPVAAI